MSARHYLDFNASAPLCPAARQAVLAALEAGVGNPSSVHACGQAARAIVDRARLQVAAMLGAEPAEIVFTSGATEANLLAWLGILTPWQTDGLRAAVTTAVEHPSILAVARQAAAAGVLVTQVPVDGCGRPDLATWADALRHVASGSRALASAMAVNNELGVVSPVAEMARLAREAGAVVHADVTQAVGRIPLDLRGWGLDLASLSGHKFGAPPGIGALWLRRGVRLQAVQGGHQEQGLRAGTENILGIAGFGAAAAQVPDRLAAASRVRGLRDRLWSGLSAIAGVHRHGHVAAGEETGQTLNVRFDGVDGPALLMALDLEDVAVSSGAACASGSLEPSHVIRALGASGDVNRQAHWRRQARGAVRFSLGPETADADVAAVLALVPGLVARIRDVPASFRNPAEPLT